MRAKIIDFVEKGEFGLASGRQPDGDYTRLWFQEMVSSDEITFDSDVYLIRKFKGAELKMKIQRGKSVAETPPVDQPPLAPEVLGGKDPVISPPANSTPVVVQPTPETSVKTLRLTGSIPSEMWNRLGTKIIPKLKSAGELQIGLVPVNVSSDAVPNLQTELRQILDDLGLSGKVKVEVE